MAPDGSTTVVALGSLRGDSCMCTPRVLGRDRVLVPLNMRSRRAPESFRSPLPSRVRHPLGCSQQPGYPSIAPGCHGSVSYSMSTELSFPLLHRCCSHAEACVPCFPESLCPPHADGFRSRSKPMPSGRGFVMSGLDTIAGGVGP